MAVNFGLGLFGCCMLWLCYRFGCFFVIVVVVATEGCLFLVMIVCVYVCLDCLSLRVRLVLLY